ncbi:serine/threonine protein kinase [Candidatus Woesearchaeota archaeon]|nr:serine/threonine protein kinase [Candidatus Woesearchaeota archaeon]
MSEEKKHKKLEQILLDIDPSSMSGTKKKEIKTVFEESGEISDEKLEKLIQKLLNFKRVNPTTYQWLFRGNIFYLDIRGWAFSPTFDKLEVVADFYSREDVRSVLEKSDSPHPLFDLLGSKPAVAGKWATILEDKKYSKDIVLTALEVLDRLVLYHPGFNFETLLPYLDSPNLLGMVRTYIMVYACDSVERFNEESVEERLSPFDKVEPCADFGRRYELLVEQFRKTDPSLVEKLNEYVTSRNRFFPSKLIPLMDSLEKNAGDPIALSYMLESEGIMFDPDSAKRLSALETKLGGPELSTDTDSKIPYRLRFTGHISSRLYAHFESFLEQFSPAAVDPLIKILDECGPHEEGNLETWIFEDFSTTLESEEFNKILKIIESDPLSCRGIISKLFSGYSESQPRAFALSKLIDALTNSEYDPKEFASFLSKLNLKNYSDEKGFNFDENSPQIVKLISYIAQGKRGNGCETLKELADMLAINIPGYKIRRKLGQGTFKKVYLAESIRSPGLLRSLKRVDPAQFGLDLIAHHYGNFESWLDAEMNITKLSKVKSPYVARPEAPVQGSDEEYYLVEEPFKETLKQRLEREGNLSLEESVRIALQISKGLAACHNYKEGPIIHRDLKPSNVGLDEEGNVKLTDFGRLESMSFDPESSEMANILYSAPEVLAGEETTIRSNIWSVGVMLYEMLTGEPFFAPRYKNGKLKPKPKKSGAAREKYEQEVRENIKNLYNNHNRSRKHLDDKLGFKGVDTMHDDVSQQIMCNVAQIIAGAVQYPDQRLYYSAESLIDDLVNTISRKERGTQYLSNLLVSSLLITPSKTGDFQSHKVSHKILEEMREKADGLLPILYRYKGVIPEKDFKKLEDGLKKKQQGDKE